MLYHSEIGIPTAIDDNKSPNIMLLFEFEQIEQIAPWKIKIIGNIPYIPSIINKLYFPRTK